MHNANTYEEFIDEDNKNTKKFSQEKIWNIQPLIRFWKY